MSNPRAAMFPGETVVGTLVANTNLVMSGIIRGVRYRVIATQDIWIRYNDTSVVLTGMYMPAKTPEYFTFGMADSQGTNLTLNIIAAQNGTVYFTPVKTVPTE
jgi:hypothetical protein